MIIQGFEAEGVPVHSGLAFVFAAEVVHIAAHV